jgi:hypothetical protein
MASQAMGRPAVRYADLAKSPMRVVRSWLCGLVVNTQMVIA